MLGFNDCLFESVFTDVFYFIISLIALNVNPFWNYEV